MIPQAFCSSFFFQCKDTTKSCEITGRSGCASWLLVREQASFPSRAKSLAGGEWSGGHRYVVRRCLRYMVFIILTARGCVASACPSQSPTLLPGGRTSIFCSTHSWLPPPALSDVPYFIYCCFSIVVAPPPLPPPSNLILPDVKNITRD